MQILNATEKCKDRFDIKEVWKNGSFYLTRTYWSKQNIKPIELSNFCLYDDDVVEFLVCVEDKQIDVKFK